MNMVYFLFIAIVIFVSGLPFCLKSVFYWKHFVAINLVISLALGATGATLLTQGEAKDKIQWNNGKCSICGSDFHFVGSNRGYKRLPTYYYECGNGHSIETISKMK